MVHSQKACSLFQAITRLVTMLGFLVVGGMAYYLYGPPPEKVALLLNRVVARAREAISSAGNPAQERPSQQSPLSGAQGGGLAPLPETNLDSQIELATALVPFDGPPLSRSKGEDPMPLNGRSSKGDLGRILAASPSAQQLRQLGAKDLKLQNWGVEQESWLFQCRVPISGAEGFGRHFDAIAPVAEQAIAQVLEEIRRWRGDISR